MKMKARFVLLLVLVGVAFASKCEEEKEQANSGGAVGAFVPSCEADGSYSAMQCHPSTGYCHCARTDGTKINDPGLGTYQSCKCIREKDEANTGAIGAFIPQCQENGKYILKQCWGSTGHCWCVNENTGEKTTAPTRDSIEC